MIRNKNIKIRIEEFKKFGKEDISQAIEELEKIKTETNRKHLQRLVFANLVDRFDILIDELLFEFATQQENDFYKVVLSKVKNEAVSKSDFFEIVLSKNPKDIVENNIKDIVRNEFARDRHSKKLRVLLESCFATNKGELDSSRVNANDGRIHRSFKRRSKTVPSTIIGYSDYLYAKRSGIVHGTGTSISKKDTEYLKKNFDSNTKTIGIKIESIKTASNFYRYLCNYMLDDEWVPKSGRRSK